ncbi:TadE/TadG family type IV pilus assembly protein [Methyloligella solikamskensis]|uniref:TadE/TadG family type IV pilus assembly protein n=1 Tax=Methyloligella solikamskensis TaxID=1177756 RepID=A0ABW3JCC6_9HYPH
MIIFRDGVRHLRRFRRDKKGASALEFAIIGSVFMLLLLGLFDVALRYAGNVALEKTVSEAGRLIRTGQAQQGSKEAFLQAVCDGVTPPLTCDKLRFDVQTYDSFGAADRALPQDDEDNYRYQPGGRNDIVVVTVFYEWPLLSFLPSLFRGTYDKSLSGDPDDDDGRLVAAAAFRNEPF